MPPIKKRPTPALPQRVPTPDEHRLNLFRYAVADMEKVAREGRDASTELIDEMQALRSDVESLSKSIEGLTTAVEALNETLKSQAMSDDDDVEAIDPNE